MADQTFASALAAADPNQLLRLENDAAHADQFTSVDQFTASQLSAALGGSEIVHITPGIKGDKHTDTVVLTAVAESDRALLNQVFALSAQQARGAWLLPEQATIRAASVNLPAYLRHRPLHALTLAHENVARTHLGSAPDALAMWALLVPIFDTLLAPITERAAGSTQAANQQQATWTAIVETYRRLGLTTDTALSIFTYRGGWAGLDRPGQAHARVVLLDMLASSDPLQIVRRIRADRLRPLIASTSKKARNGTPLARQVLTKTLQPVLASYFGGDWLEFLSYVGLPPNPNEEMITALPSPRLFVGGSANATTVAEEHGLDTDEVNAMLAAFLGQSSTVSPVEQRVNALSRWWNEFDAIHAQQTPGKPALWGLVEDGPYTIGYGQGPTPQLYRHLLTADLVEEVNYLWDGVILPRWPEAIVSEPYPHKLMAEALGPAVDFWHGVALTAWYVCEGPQSRTPLPGLRRYYQRPIAALATSGTPIHPSLFDELEQAERHLGPPQDLETHIHELQMEEGGVSVRYSGGGQRRDGFEILRDIITRHRRGWTQRYFSEYVRHRWNYELAAVARELHRTIASKGKTPTFRAFARIAAPAANHWFNGDLASLYTAIGERAPATPPRVDLLPTTAHEFIDAVYAALGGEHYEEHLRITDFPTADGYRQRSRLATASTLYVQIAEAVGRDPEPAEFGANRYEWDWAGDLNTGWNFYRNAIKQVLAMTHAFRKEGS